MKLEFYNSLNKKKEEFIPLNPNNIGVYVCGPTVYDLAHIGNARSVVVFDLLFRLLNNKYGNQKVTYVRNITDVDDKINKRALEKNINISDLTKKTTQIFHENIQALNCLKPTFEPKATDHINEMIKMIESLIEKGCAYEAKSHVLFSVSNYKDYGKLSNRSYEEMIAGARVEVAPFKKDAADFVLWKPSNDDEPGWDSPWGKGRPGWHIECSAMSKKYLGDDFDIHAGGADLKFPHHENEIAQSCCANDNSSYAKYWIHNGFLSVNGEKMSKSLGNFITIDELLKANISGELIRLALLTTHYRKPLNWTNKLLDDAKLTIAKFTKIIEIKCDDDTEESLIDEGWKNKFYESIYDDLNTPKALAVLHSLCSDKNLSEVVKSSTLKNLCDLVGICQQEKEVVDEEDESIINQMIDERNLARKNKDWQKADQIRDKLNKMSIYIKDNSDGTTGWKRS